MNTILAKSPSAPLLAARGLTKSYRGRCVVDGVDLDIKPGEVFALLGPNGAGKSTTVGMLSGLVRPDAGSVHLLGAERRLGAVEARRHIAVCLQETAVAPQLSVAENLLLAARLYGWTKLAAAGRAAELMAALSLSDVAGARARTLSGGLQRRLSVAMALMPQTPLVFLDEPTLGLDPQARRGLWDYVAGLKGQVGVLLTTHYLEEADALADRVAIIRDGRIVALDTPAGLKAGLGLGRFLTVRTAPPPESLAAELAARFGPARATADGLELPASAGFDTVVDLFRRHGPPVAAVELREPSLDDVFFALTGTEVRP